MIDPRFYLACKSFTLDEIGKHLNINITYFDGTPDTIIHGISSIEKQVPETATFILDKKNFVHAANNGALMCIVKSTDIPANHPFQALIISDTPKHTFAALAQLFYKDIDRVDLQPASHIKWPDVQIDPSAIIDERAEIGKGTRIGPFVTLHKGVTLGHNCILYDHVTVSHALIGNAVSIHPGTRIGQAGFGFAMEGAKPVDLPHLGRVIIEDNVHIGSNTTIDRGFLSDTQIGEGSRIDNLVQIAHNVRVGKGCVIIAQVGIAGSTEIGDGAILAGQAGITDHIKIGKNAIIAAQTGVSKSVPDHAVMGGSPAVPIMEWRRQSIILSQLARGKK